MTASSVTSGWEGAASYYRYWGKARLDDMVDGEPCHLLPFHSLDVAAVAHLLMSPESSRCKALAERSEMPPEQLQSLFVFSMVLHDLGKFSRSFQSLADTDFSELVPPDPSLAYGTPEWPHHSEAGAVFLESFLEGQLKSDGLQRWGWREPIGRSRFFVRSLLGTAFGHHGCPVSAKGRLLPSPYPEDQQAAWTFALDVAKWLKPAWPASLIHDKNWFKRFRALTWHLAGFGVLADWLGSDQSVFAYQSTPESLASYWDDKALPGACRVLDKVGFGFTPSPRPFPGVHAFFGFRPTPLQQWAQDLEWKPGPQLFVLEDVTGAGKTEAAMALAHRLMENGQAEGVYFALPTMATSNAMYGRVEAVYRRWFDDAGSANLVLAHGARHHNPQFTDSVIPEQSRDHSYGSKESTASEACNQWFADSRKKAMLADVGVGTVDQALMAVLPFKHQTLRLVGLANKVLIVDEVHACDDYMATLLEAVLEAHARQGGSAILLTATLPHVMKQSLVRAYRRGRGQESEDMIEATAFPLASRVTDRGMETRAVSTRESVIRHVTVAPLHAQEDVVQHLLKNAEAGQCACWIRNTVDDAISAYQVLRERAAEPDKVMLFHSRYVMADRQAIEQAALERFGKESTAASRAGWILVSTQVVEQSLDLDFDQMVSDLAPMDLLIQRAGRLHRHCRDAIGDRVDTQDERPAPRLHLFAPAFQEQPGPDWLSADFPGTGAVYQDHGRLWLTLKTLREEGGIKMPGRARHLIESVYGEAAPDAVPEGLRQRQLDQDGERRSHRAMADFNRLRMEQGYCPEAGKGWMEDMDIGTRLNEEPSVTVTLVRQTEAGALAPWVEAERFAWELSQIKVRESLARRLPELSEAMAEEREALLKRQPGLKFSRLWLAQEEQESMKYNGEFGLYRRVIARPETEEDSP